MLCQLVDKDDEQGREDGAGTPRGQRCSGEHGRGGVGVDVGGIDVAGQVGGERRVDVHGHAKITTGAGAWR